MKVSDPILSCADSAEFEKALLRDFRAELDAMARAGDGVARRILEEFGGMLGERPEVLVIAGKGHNGGDALCAARAILKARPSCVLKIFLAASIEELKPNTAYFAKLIMRESGSVRFIKKDEIGLGADIMIEGLLGMSFKPPMRGDFTEIVKLANDSPCRIKAAIDMPAGLSDEDWGIVFKADVTYMTGIAKAPVFKEGNAQFSGRLRYVDLGFFPGSENPDFGIVSDNALKALKKLRAAQSDKRAYGHLFIFAGSANYAGAALMNARAALRSGVGLVSAFVPESIAAPLAAAEPACIWIPCPETEGGSLSLETFSLYKAEQGRATAILAGSGLGDSAETSALVCEIAKTAEVPLVFDADAVRKNVLAASAGKRILLTPHAGEFLRVAGDRSNEALLDFCATENVSCILKGAVSRVCDGRKIAHVCAGGPQLSRAGSGDLLAGIAGALAARPDLCMNLFECGCAAALLAGRAAEHAFAACGENAYAASDASNFLQKAFNE